MIKILMQSGWRALLGNIFPWYRSPIGVYFHITSRCNQACCYCGYSRLNRSGGKELPLAVVLSYIDDMAAAGVKKINVTGGEPLLHPDITDILRHARDQGMYVVVSTNGTLVPRYISALKYAHMVMLSFDGRRDHHELLRGAATFSAVWRAMERMRDNGIPFWTTTTLHARNIEDIDYILDTVEDFGTYANFLLVQFFPQRVAENSLPEYAEVADIFPGQQEVRRAFGYLLRLKKQGRPVGSTAPFLKFMMQWPDYKKLFSAQKYMYTCFAGRLYAHIYFDGKLYACGHCIGELDGISLDGRNFTAAFNGLKKRTQCASCRVACDSENNLIYSLNAEAVCNWLRRMKIKT